MTSAAWPLGLIPRRSPPFFTGLAISIASLAGAIVLRAILLGAANATGISATTFPALMVATLYAGSRWGWATLAAALAIGVWTPIQWVGASPVSIFVMFTISAGLCVLVCAGLREALLLLDEASAGQVAAQRSLEATESRFRALADSAPILMWVSRMDGSREFVNRCYVEFLGTDYKTALDLDFRKVLHPDDLDHLRNERDAGEATPGIFTLEGRYLRHDGEYRWVRSISQPRWDADGAISGFVGVGFDITEAKQVEADLKRINDLLAERVHEALAERDEAEAALHRAQKLEAVGQLTGGVAHDFNNLLTVVIGALDLMQRHPKDEARRQRMIEAALGAAHRGERLVQQLLAFSRRQALQPEPVQVDALLRDIEPLLRQAVGEAVTLEVRPGASTAVVSLDRSQFEAAILNLVVNARDATANAGLIRIETRRVRLKARHVEALAAGDYLCVGVHDTGAGMDETTLRRAFEPFFTTKAPGRGTGLGLSQVYGFAAQSGGTATVDSAPGKGANVCLYLPIVEVALASETTGEPSPRAEVGPSLRVLVAEDDAQVAELVEAMLEELGHTVTRAENAEAALGILLSGASVDLLISDLIMPGDRSGVELAREAVALRPRLPVILSSGYTGEVLTAAEHTPWPLLRKPYTPDQLARTIAEVVGKTEKLRLRAG